MLARTERGMLSQKGKIVPLRGAWTLKCKKDDMLAALEYDVHIMITHALVSA